MNPNVSEGWARKLPEGYSGIRLRPSVSSRVSGNQLKLWAAGLQARLLLPFDLPLHKFKLSLGGIGLFAGGDGG
ncbi:hypothetical protein ACFV9D_05985 [Streptomyces sp. NPDC059875]|uniref:hypothetical protein n=1 Tax=unclassified Streptomyces TaxID=2593676 RepID=UPI00364F4F49